jgi:two-component system OmpR family response regulator
MSDAVYPEHSEEAPADLPAEGRLDDTALADVLHHLTRRKATGTLGLYQDNVVKAIFLKGGEIVFATSTLKADRLGEILLRNGSISRSALQATTKVMQESGKREGETLVEMGILAPKALFEGLKLQVEEIIISAFLWEHGRYRFMEGSLPAHVVPLPIHLDQLLPKALDRMRTD